MRDQTTWTGMGILSSLAAWVPAGLQWNGLHQVRQTLGPAGVVTLQPRVRIPGGLAFRPQQRNPDRLNEHIAAT
jgi:hypothetical protein